MKITFTLFILLSILICLEGRGGGARGGGRGISGGRSASVSSSVKSAPMASSHIVHADSPIVPKSGDTFKGAKPIPGNNGVVGGSSNGIYPIPIIGGGVHNSGYRYRNLTKSNENMID